tara:strand:+ start:1067 stop:1294 length:228 start_codon:yes stop_codon:yes gene_type:complete
MTSCSGYMRVDGNAQQHGAIPEVHTVKNNAQIEKTSSTAFWLFYSPLLLGAIYLTYAAFKPTKKAAKDEAEDTLN